MTLVTYYLKEYVMVGLHEISFEDVEIGLHELSFEDAKGLLRSRNSMDSQYNGKKQSCYRVSLKLINTKTEG